MENKTFNGDKGLANLLQSEIIKDFNNKNLKVYKSGSFPGNLATYRVVDFFPATENNSLFRDHAYVEYFNNYDWAMHSNHAYCKSCGGFAVVYEKSGRSWFPIQVIA